MRQQFMIGTVLLAVTVAFTMPAWAQRAAATDKPAVKEAAVARDKAKAKAEDKNKDKGEDKEPEVTFEFLPSSVSMNSSLNFDQNGKLSNSNSNLSIGLRVKYESNAQPVVVRNIIATRVITDAKEHLTSQSQGYEQTLFSWENSNSRNNTRKEFRLQMSFVAPARPAQKLTEISGTMDVVYASGEPSEAVLKPFSEFEGKRITFKDMPGEFISFSREDRNRGGNNQQQIRVEMPKSLRPHIAKISFFDEGGRELTYNGWGGGSTNGTEYRTLQVPLPDKGQIRIQLYPRVDTKQVPFTIKNVPLAPEVKGEAGEVMVELKPIAPPDGELQLERLEPVVAQ